MAEDIDLEALLNSLPSVKYSDLKKIEEKAVRLALRRGSFETNEDTQTKIVCRVFDRGYGVASVDRLSKEYLDKVVKEALHLSRSIDLQANLASVPIERGVVERSPKKVFDLSEAERLMSDLQSSLRSKVGPVYSSSEFVLSYVETDSTLVTSEGSKVKEKGCYIDLIIYLIVKQLTMGYASHIVGGQCGLEVFDLQNWDRILDDLVLRANSMLKARILPPLDRGRKFAVILDTYASGAVAHEVAHMLEGDQAQVGYFSNLNLAEDLEIIDNPLIPGGYGSFVWDDEGVRGNKKVLIGRGEINLLHTRLTARGDEVPGNAHGATHIPKPTVSNVYIKPSDWKIDEIFEDTRSGIYARGVIRAEMDISSGRFELIPEIAYLIDKKESKASIKNLRISDSLRNIVRQIDAIGGNAFLRPNFEKGFCISEGGPYVRLNGVHCT